MKCDKSFLRTLQIRWKIAHTHQDYARCAGICLVVAEKFAASTAEKFMNECTRFAEERKIEGVK